MGGTFDQLHKGHKALLSKAFSLGDRVLIGLTSNEFALKTRKEVNDFERRKRKLERYLQNAGLRNYEITRIDDEQGPATHREDLDAIVVSAERLSVAEKINSIRRRKGLHPLQIHRVPMFLAEDCCPISSKRMRAGEIDGNGRMLRPLRVNVGSDNRVKISGVRAVVGRLYRRTIVKGWAVDSGVPSQPWGSECVEGAISRAKAALKDADFGVGIEAGLFESPRGEMYDVQYCAVVDKVGRVTLGHGPGFQYPPSVAAQLKGRRTVSEIMSELTGIKDIGRGVGAIGFLSRGRMNRTELTKSAVLMAFLPRINKDLYFSDEA